jgi:Fic family protein/DNA-binding XRE family transcriptional regulator
MKIQEKLKFIIKISGFTQDKLSKELDVSFVTLNSWINERSEPHKKSIEKIDNLYKELTGEKVIPATQLESKKQIIKSKEKQYKNILKIILEKQDIYDEFILSLTYNTNSIEGSTLTEHETADVLFNDIALPDKSLIEQLEAKNHQTALKYLFEYITKKDVINEELILKLHSILMNGIRDDAGLYRSHAVRIVGANVSTANHIKVPELMKNIVKNINKDYRDTILHISEVHSKFEKIHPFSDGNGRIGRLLIDAMLLKENLPPAVIKQEKKQFYYSYLNKSQVSDDFSLLEDFIADAVIEGFRMIEKI